MPSLFQFFFLFFLFFPHSFSKDYDCSIPIRFSGSSYFLPFYESGTSFLIALSTIAPVQLFASDKCSKCKGIRVTPDTTPVEKNVSVKEYYREFTGDMYVDQLKIGNLIESIKYLAFTEITYANEYKGNGRISISYYNYNFTSEKKVFAYDFNNGETILFLGGYDTSIVKDHKKLKTFDVKIEGSGDNKLWYVEFEHIYINGKESDMSYKNNNTNINDIGNNEKTKVNPSPIKLTADIGISSLIFPKDFFMKNVEKILPKDGKCSMQRSGVFVCQCEEDYKKLFANISFVDKKNNILLVNVSDYVIYNASIAGSYCEVAIELNYDTDNFYIGYNVMNNYLNIFDIDNMTYSIYQTSEQYLVDEKNYYIIFILTSISSLIFLFGGYHIYSKFFLRNEEEHNHNLVEH